MNNDLLVLLSHGHAGRPDAPRSRGAVVDGLQERNLSLEYMRACQEVIESAGGACWMIADGTLPDRQARAVEHGEAWIAGSDKRIVLYVACHLDVNGGHKRGIVFHDFRSTLGARVATHVRDSLCGVAGVGERKVIAAGPANWTKRAYSTIKGIYQGPEGMAGICYEPLSLDCPEHRALIREGGLSKVGTSLGLGLLLAAEHYRRGQL